MHGSRQQEEKNEHHHSFDELMHNYQKQGTKDATLELADYYYQLENYGEALNLYKTVFTFYDADKIFLEKVFKCAININNAQYLIKSYHCLLKLSLLEDEVKLEFDDFKSTFFTTELTPIPYLKGIERFKKQYPEYTLSAKEIKHLHHCQYILQELYVREYASLTSLPAKTLLQVRDKRGKLNYFSDKIQPFSFLSVLQQAVRESLTTLTDAQNLNLERRCLAAKIAKITQRYNTSCKRHILISFKDKYNLIRYLLGRAEYHFRDQEIVNVIEYLDYRDQHAEHSLSEALQHGRWGRPGITVNSYQQLIEELNMVADEFGDLVLQSRSAPLTVPVMRNR